jgi:hypothetical protein
VSVPHSGAGQKMRASDRFCPIQISITWKNFFLYKTIRQNNERILFGEIRQTGETIFERIDQPAACVSGLDVSVKKAL